MSHAGNDVDEIVKNDTFSKALYFGALGVVFGDIGTSPIYALRESLTSQMGSTVPVAFLLGILSLIFWSLVLVISIKYLMFVLRANNHGEGGIMALVALLTPKHNKSEKYFNRLLILLGLFGACLLYGDGTITPAISVLSAVEGLHVALPQLSHLVTPLTVVILIGLFALQKKGSGVIGKWFGIVMLVWFSVLAILGVNGILKAPVVLTSLNPVYAVQFLMQNGLTGYLTLGAVFLVITGGEALYADLGHFGAPPIQRAWITLVFPALLLNYLGQGALIITEPVSASAPFFHLAPDWAAIPLVLLATAATIIASQAVISGTFSLTRQAIQLGHLPRMRVVFTDVEASGQIYIPVINWLLMLACIGLVLGFKSSDAMASAYGVAVSLDMLITTVLAISVAIRFRWHPAFVFGVGVFFFAIDSAFLGANLVKVPEGGWYALVVAAAVFLVMISWRAGRQLLATRLSTQSVHQQDFFQQLEKNPPIRIPGTAVVMTGHLNDTIPASLVHHFKCTGVLHEKVILLTVTTSQHPHVPAAERLTYENLSHSIARMTLHFGFSQPTNIPLALKLSEHLGFPIDIDNVIYILSRETLIAKRDLPGLPYWQELLFVTLSRNAGRATAYFRLPEHQVLEIGIEVSL